MSGGCFDGRRRNSRDGEGVSDRTGGVSVGRCGTQTHISKCRSDGDMLLTSFFRGLGYGSGRKQSSIIIDHDHEGWVGGGASTVHRFALCP